MVVGGIYTGVSEDFTRNPLNGCSRTLKAEKHDAGVVIYEQVRRDADG